MKYTQIPSDTFSHLVLNAGILAESFEPSTGEFSSLIGATTGGITFNSNPTFEDWGEDIDNCPNNTAELKRITAFDPAVSGNFLTLTEASLSVLVAAGTATTTSGVVKVVPRHELEATDFKDIWFIGDYSDVNTGSSAGFLAIHIIRGLNTSSFQITTSKNAKGQMAFDFHGHYTIDDPEEVPFELYMLEGEEEEETT